MRKSAAQTSSFQTSDENRWTPGARLVLAAVILFLIMNIAQIVYRFTIPSLGWAGQDPDTVVDGSPYIKLNYNAVGASSVLQPGDIVETVEGIAAKDLLNIFPPKSELPPDWKVGEEVELTIVREGQHISLNTRLVHWTAAAWLKTNFGNFSGILDWIPMLLLLWAGAFTFFNRPGNLSARFLFAFGLASLSSSLGDSIPDYLSLLFNPTAAMAKVFFSNIIFAYLIGPSFLGYALTFPKPKVFIQHQPRWLLLPFLIGSLTIILLFTVPDLAVIGFGFTFAMLLLGVSALIHSGLTMRDAISQAQLKWAVGGVAAGVAVFLLNMAAAVPQPFRDIFLALARFGPSIIGFSLAIAILRYRLFDIDLIIRRTLQYALLSGLLALVYFGAVTILQGLFTNISGQQSPASLVLSTLVIAALFNPLRWRVQNFIDRRFYRQKYDTEKALAAFAKVSRNHTELEPLTSELIGTIQETLQPEQVSLWLQPNSDRRRSFSEQK